MTDWAANLHGDQTFLHEQIVDAEHKIARYESALETCNECQEADSLRAMLHTAQEERDLLTDLLAQQSGENALSLDGLLMLRINTLEHEVARLSYGWQRGHSVSPDYWELESKLVFLADLHRRYHAWESGRPYYPPVTVNGAELPEHGTYVHPWYIPVPPNIGIGNGEHESEDPLAALNAVQKTITDLLHQQGFPENHFKVTAQPDDSVFITGYVHNEDERERIFKVISMVSEVRELLAGIQVVDEAHCPLCAPPNQTGRVD